MPDGSVLGERASLQTDPPQDRPLTTLKELRPSFVFVYKASAFTPFWGQDKGREATALPAECADAKGRRPGRQGQ